MLRRLSLVSLAPLLLVAAGAAQDISGTWTAKVSQKEPDQLNLRFYMTKDQHSQMGTDFAVAELEGLTASSLSAPSADVKFQLTREAGTIKLEGHFRNGDGAGDFTFTASQQYRNDMAQLGYPEITDRKMFELAIIGVTTDYTKEVKSLGYSPTLQKLIEARIFNVNRELVAGLKSVGFDGLAISKLVEARIFNVTPDFIRQMRGSGFNLPFQKYVEMRIHGITPEFRQQMATAGYPELPLNRLVEFKIHGVTPEFIQQMRALGFDRLSPSKLVEFRIFNVNEEQIAELKSLGYSGLSARQLVDLRVHGVDRAFIEEVRKAGYRQPTIQQLIDMKIMGIRKNAKLM